MKKFTIVGIMLLALGVTAFARGHQNWDGNNNMMGRGHHSGSYCGGMGTNQNGFKRSPEMERSRLVMDEKRLEIRKELIKDKPDWNKVEKLNTEIANEQGRMRTTAMRTRVEYNQNLANKPQ